MKYFFFFLVIFLFSCTKEDIVKNEDFSYFINKNFLVHSYFFEDFVTGEKYELTNNREIDTIYLIFRESYMYLGKVENLPNNTFGLGVDRYDIQINNDIIKINRDRYSDYNLIQFNKEFLIIEGKHLLHNQQQRITISIEEVIQPTPNLENIIQSFITN